MFEVTCVLICGSSTFPKEKPCFFRRSSSNLNGSRPAGHGPGLSSYRFSCRRLPNECAIPYCTFGPVGLRASSSAFRSSSGGGRGCLTVQAVWVDC